MGRKTLQSASNEKYTPPEFARAAHFVMSGIELDPASCERANTVIKAKRFFGIEDDGLQKPWHAETVYNNPPGPPRPWWNRLGHFFDAGFVKHAIFCVYRLEALSDLQPRANFPAWRGGPWSSGFPLCVPRTRLHYYDENLAPLTSPRFGSCFCLVSNDAQVRKRFATKFSVFGAVR